MKTKRLVSLLLAMVLVLSCSVTTFAKSYFYKDFASIEEMNSFFEKYSADFPNVEYSDNGIHASSKYFTLKNKDFLEVYINDPDYICTTVHCSEVAYERGIDGTFLDYEHTNGFYEAYISVSYDLSKDWVDKNLEDLIERDSEYTEIYTGEIMGYPYVASDYGDEGGEECTYKIAVDDVLVSLGTNTAYDKNFIESVVVKKTGITLPVYEQVEQKPIEVSDELLSAVRVDYHSNEITKDDVNISDLLELSETKQFVRLSVSGSAVTCDVVEQRIGDYLFYVPQRPLPQVLYDGVLYELKDAYNAGVITDDDMDVIATFESRSYHLYHKSVLLGDITGDFEVDVYDATTIQRCLAGLSNLSWQSGEEFADFDEDGEVSILDATGIQMKIAKIQ